MENQLKESVMLERALQAEPESDAARHLVGNVLRTFLRNPRLSPFDKSRVENRLKELQEEER